MAVLLLGTIYIGPLSIRQIAVVVMTLFLALFYFRTKKLNRLETSYIWIYIVYLIFFAIALLANGDFFPYNFPRKLLSHYLVGIVCYFAVDCLVKKYDDFTKVAYVFLCIILIDSYVTYLQFNNNSLGWIIGMIFSDISEKEDFFANYISAVGSSVTPGIFGHPVNNAIFIATLMPYGLIILKNQSVNFVFKIVCVFVIILSFYACALIQQRAAFFSLIFVYLYFIAVYVFNKRHFTIVLLSSIILICGLLFTIDSSDMDFGRFASTKSESRVEIWNYAFKFIDSHFLFGGPVQFGDLAGFSAHNIILDSLIYSGIAGLCLMLLLYFKSLFFSLKLFKYGNEHKGSVMLASASALLIILLMAMFHNVSYLTGDALVFIILALALKAHKLKILA